MLSAKTCAFKKRGKNINIKDVKTLIFNRLSIYWPIAFDSANYERLLGYFMYLNITNPTK